MNKKKILFFIVILGAALRLFGIGWDNETHLHPDERFLTMVTTALKWPSNPAEYFDPHTSPLNPRNANFSFFVYGTFPIFMVKAAAHLVQWDTYERVPIVGRALSAYFDLITIVLVFVVAYELTRYTKNALPERITRFIPSGAAFLYAISVLPIQLSHFYAVDLYVVTALTACFYMLLVLFRKTRLSLVLSTAIGILLGIALGSKISAILFTPIIGLGIAAFPFFESKKTPKQSKLQVLAKYMLTVLTLSVIVALTSYITLRLTNPYMFASGNLFDPTPHPEFIKNLKELKSWEEPETRFPPAIQWITTTPVVFPLRTLIYHGLGLPLGLLTLAGFGYFSLLIGRVLIYGKSKEQSIPLLLVWLWITGFFLFQSIQFVKAMRYFAPLYPFLAVTTAFLVGYGIGLFTSYLSKSKTAAIVGILGIVLLLWPLAFTQIYTKEHTRKTASRWIYANIPADSTIACEHWDDCLPLSFSEGQRNYIAQQYTLELLNLYDAESEEKWQKINELLGRADYIVVSSNRLYGSILTIPYAYPETSAYYQSLFDGSLGYSKVAEFTSRPTIPLAFVSACLALPGDSYGYIANLTQECHGQGIQIVDDYTDESFTVYDHPKVIIFKRVQK